MLTQTAFLFHEHKINSFQIQRNFSELFKCRRSHKSALSWLRNHLVINNVATIVCLIRKHTLVLYMTDNILSKLQVHETKSVFYSHVQWWLGSLVNMNRFELSSVFYWCRSFSSAYNNNDALTLCGDLSPRTPHHRSLCAIECSPNYDILDHACCTHYA